MFSVEVRLCDVLDIKHLMANSPYELFLLLVSFAG